MAPAGAGRAPLAAHKVQHGQATYHIVAVNLADDPDGGQHVAKGGGFTGTGTVRGNCCRGWHAGLRGVGTPPFVELSKEDRVGEQASDCVGNQPAFPWSRDMGPQRAV